MKEKDEKILIELCLQGNRDSFAGLVVKYQSSVMALSMNILGSRDDALDIVQETFVQAYVHLDRFDLQRNFKTWLLSIAVKRCLDHLRKQKSFLNYFLKHSRELRTERNREHKKIEDSEIFSPLLKHMKDKERIALVLKINEGYSAGEIARVLDCSESTARVHLFNAKQRLKKHLTGEAFK